MKEVYDTDLRSLTQWNDILRFQKYNVCVTYCLPVTKSKQNPNLTALS